MFRDMNVLGFPSNISYLEDFRTKFEETTWMEKKRYADLHI